MLPAAVERLRCPRCHAPLAPADRALRCPAGHAYDLARQGWVSLPAPGGTVHRGDSAEMAAARARFLAAGHFDPIAEALAVAAAPLRLACAVDLGGGTGFHLARVLADHPSAVGLALDASRPALRHALRASDRIAAVACDAWQPLPLRDGAADLVLNVFAPRNPAEIARVLAPEGTLLVVTPTDRHLGELRAPLGLLDVAAAKQERLRAQLAPHMTPIARRLLAYEMSLARDDVRALVAMGPSAHHVGAQELEERLARLPDPVAVTAAVAVESFRRSG